MGKIEHKNFQWLEGFQWLKLPSKKIRALMIVDHLVREVPNSYKAVLCFSSGNAAKALRNRLAMSCTHGSMPFLEIGNGGTLSPNTWWHQNQITKHFPKHFDATSGHLSITMMELLGSLLKSHIERHLNTSNTKWLVPTGSGETLVALKMAMPNSKFIAVYNLDEHTEFSCHAPLNSLVTFSAEYIIKNSDEQFKQETGYYDHPTIVP